MSLLSFLREYEPELPVPKYETVRANNLTLEELKKSKLPNSCVTSIWVDLVSPARRFYIVAHNRDLIKGPHILMTSFGPDKNAIGRLRVTEIMSRIVNGIPEKEIIPTKFESSEAISQVIKTQELPTQQLVAKFVEEYMKHFLNVTIPVAHFQGVPIRAYQHSGLPKEKLSVKKA